MLDNYPMDKIIVIDGEDSSYFDLNSKVLIWSIFSSIKNNHLHIFLKMYRNKWILHLHNKRLLYFKREIKNENVFPIAYSIPKSLIINPIIKKDRVISFLIPGIKQTYRFENENQYYSHYSKSYFALSYKKGGWDCLRHYEIIASGTIPYFPDIENCPVNTMFSFPKTLILKSNELFINNDWENTYESILLELKSYALKRLTTKVMAEHVLSKTGLFSIHLD